MQKAASLPLFIFVFHVISEAKISFYVTSLAPPSNSPLEHKVMLSSVGELQQFRRGQCMSRTRFIKHILSSYRDPFRRHIPNGFVCGKKSGLYQGNQVLRMAVFAATSRHCRHKTSSKNRH